MQDDPDPSKFHAFVYLVLKSAEDIRKAFHTSYKYDVDALGTALTDIPIVDCQILRTVFLKTIPPKIAVPTTPSAPETADTHKPTAPPSIRKNLKKAARDFQRAHQASSNTGDKTINMPTSTNPENAILNSLFETIFELGEMPQSEKAIILWVKRSAQTQDLHHLQDASQYAGCLVATYQAAKAKKMGNTYNLYGVFEEILPTFVPNWHLDMAA